MVFECLVDAECGREFATTAMYWRSTAILIDWMRHPAVYDAAGTADIGPELRTGRRSWLAAVVLLVVGCLSSLYAQPRAADAGEA